ncbi:MAG TPA: hypothetical protein VGN94_14015 [Methylobacterium sp.]|jgi:hypothetical protein|nr:hypothetical protein [Methylobacterium sp.]
MKLATLACLTVLSLIGSAAPHLAAAAQPTLQPVAAAPSRSAPPAATPQPAAPNAARSGPAPRAGERRRRNSYAYCNRNSQQRGLRGGARRRFLIRCRLGYERNRPPASAQPGAQQGANPQGTGPQGAVPQGATPQGTPPQGAPPQTPAQQPSAAPPARRP